MGRLYVDLNIFFMIDGVPLKKIEIYIFYRMRIFVLLSDEVRPLFSFIIFMHLKDLRLSI